LVEQCPIGGGLLFIGGRDDEIVPGGIPGHGL
jgi:hypothetical protein